MAKENGEVERASNSCISGESQSFTKIVLGRWRFYCRFGLTFEALDVALFSTNRLGFSEALAMKSAAFFESFFSVLVWTKNPAGQSSLSQLVRLYSKSSLAISHFLGFQFTLVEKNNSRPCALFNLFVSALFSVHSCTNLQNNILSSLPLYVLRLEAFRNKKKSKWK